MPILSLRAYARHRGVALSAVQKAIQTKRISTQADGRIDSEQADKIVSARYGEDGVPGTDDDMPYRSTAEVMTRGLAGTPIGGGVPVTPPSGLQEGVGVSGNRDVQNGVVGSSGMAAIAQRFLGVNSQYFEVTVQATVADYHRTYFAVIHRRQGRDPEIIKFYAN